MLKHKLPRFLFSSSPHVYNSTENPSKVYSSSYDSIIIGAGHNGLICGNYLAKSGQKVLILENRHKVGGAAISEELKPGYKLSRASYVLSLLRKKIIEELFPKNWEKELIFHRRRPSSFTPTLENNKYLVLGNGESNDFLEISKFSSKDAHNYKAYNQMLSEFVEIVNPYLDQSPRIWNYEVFKKILRHFRVGKRNIIPEFYNFLTAPASTILNQWFESDILKTTLAADSIIGALNSPYDVGSAYILLHHVMGEITDDGSWVLVEGGMGSVSEFLAKLAVEKGVKICLNSPVKEIIIDGKKAKGIILSTGEKIYGNNIITNCTDFVTFNKLINQKELNPRYMNNVNYEGPQTKFNLIVKELPKFKSISHIYNGNESYDEIIQKSKAFLTGTIHMGCSNLDEIHSAYLDAKNGNFSTRPYIEMTIPSVLDKTLVPKNSEDLVITLFVQYSPYNLNGGWTPEAKNQWKNTVYKTIDEYAPNFSKSIVFEDILTPKDIEEVFGLTGGNIFHGALSLNNIFFSRPNPYQAHYKTHIEALYRCGSDAHPGGGVMGAPGRNCANEILKK